ncbi:hypothetical protein MMC10_006375 [Thelotrema lepadinum]|nr:hypothetical protein [Thelotrema lepadinum]
MPPERSQVAHGSASEIEDARTTEAIDEFISRYERYYYFWDSLLKHAADLCEKGLIKHGRIPSEVTARVKSRKSLRKKLVERQAAGQHYKNDSDITRDIVDIVGTRISLFFPNSKSAVDEMIYQTFRDVEVRDHPLVESKEPQQQQQENVEGSIAIIAPKSSDQKTPYENKFSGYTARHYRVKLRDASPIQGSQEQVIEVQVVSALAHVWSKVQHGLVYKVFHDAATDDERRLLDSLNGLVQTGEVILEQIQQLSAKRMLSNPDFFENKYEVGAYLLKEVPPQFVKTGSISVLHKFLCVFKMNKSADLAPRILKLGWKGPNSPEETAYRRRIREKFHPFEPSASVYLVDFIFSQLPKEDVDEAERKARAAASSSGNECTYACKVVLSSLIWLWQLFSSPLEGTLSEQIANHFFGTVEEKRSLKWALDSIMPSNILLNHTPKQGDKEKLQTLWHVFESSQLEVFKFAFKISRIGVWRQLPKDITQLEKMRMSLKPFEKTIESSHASSEVLGSHWTPPGRGIDGTSEDMLRKEVQYRLRHSTT